MADRIELGNGTIIIKMRSGAVRLITPEKTPSPTALQKDAATMTRVPVTAAAENKHREKIAAVLK